MPSRSHASLLLREGKLLKLDSSSRHCTRSDITSTANMLSIENLIDEAVVARLRGWVGA